MTFNIWVNIAFCASIILFALWAARFDGVIFKSLWRHFRSFPRLTQVMMALVLSLAIMYGGAKETHGGGGESGRKNSPLRNPPIDETEEDEPGDLPDEAITNCIWISNFSVCASNKTINGLHPNDTRM